MLSQYRQELAISLFEIGAIKFGRFKLKLHEKNSNAPLSPIYVDLRIMRSFPKVIESAVAVYEELASGIEFNLYADVPTAATPIVALLSHKRQVPMITPRTDKKTYGSKQLIDGVFKAGEFVLVIDDLITKAESKLEAIRILEDNELVVKDVAVLVDREQGGEKELNAKGYTLHCAFKLKELLNFYLENGKINKEKYKGTLDYISGN